MTVATSNSPAVPDQVPLLRGPIIGAVVVVLLLVALFWEFFSSQMKWAISEQADWGHTLVVPFIAGYFVYLNREKLLARGFKTTWIGLVPVLLGLGVYVACSMGPQVLSHHNLRGLGVAITITGIVLLFTGFRAMAILWFPLLYMFVFGQTISYRLMEIATFKMQDIAAVGSAVSLEVLGVDVDREGNTLYLYNEGIRTPLNIAEACSGMRMLMAFLALGVAMAYTGLRRFWQRAAVILMGVPVAIFVNILRVTSLGLLAMVDANLAAGDFHSFVGLIWLLPAFMIFLGVIWIVRNLVTDEEAPSGAA